jgi:hypothetical protein
MRWAVRGRQATDRRRHLEPLTGFSGCEVGAFRPVSGEVPITNICGLFDTKRGTLIGWRLDQHRLQVVELSRWQWHDGKLVVLLRMILGVVGRSKCEQYLRNLYANVVYLLVQPLRELSRRSKNVCVGPSAAPLRFSARFADFSVRPARTSDGSSLGGLLHKLLRYRNIAGWAVLPVASGRGA